MIERRFLMWPLIAVTIACRGTDPATPPSPVVPSGEITYSLSGSVREWPGVNGIADATVSVVDGPDAGYAAVTDALGRYRLAGLKGGELTVAVAAPDHAPYTTRMVLTSNQVLDFRLRHSGAPYEVEGRVVDEDGRPLAGASVSFSYSSPEQSLRYSDAVATTNAAGMFRVAFSAVPGGYAGSVAFARTTKDGHEADNRWFHGNAQGALGTLDFHLYRVRRITAGESLVVTITPSDSLCYNNVRDSPGIGPDYVCRTVRVVAIADGVLRLDVMSASNGTRPNLAIETVHPAPYLWRFENPVSIPVTAGTEVLANIELGASSPNRESYVLTSAMMPQD
jgi:hypothetical protein